MTSCSLIGAFIAALCSVAFTTDTHAEAGAQKQCYSCSTSSHDRILSFHMTPVWRQRLQNIPPVNISAHCVNMHTHEELLASGILPVPCVGGICAEMRVKEQNGTLHVWRGCLDDPKDSIPANCDNNMADDGTSWEACACEGSLCNSATRTRFEHIIAVIVALSFFRLFFS